MNGEALGRENPQIELPELCAPIAEASPMPMAGVQGSSHAVRYVNPAFCALVGKSKEELIGKDFSDVVTAGEECLSLLDRLDRTGQPQTSLGKILCASHSFCWSYSIWPLIGLHGHPVGILIAVTETTHNHEQAAAINQALMIGTVHQHELRDEAEKLTAQRDVEIAERKQAHEALSQKESAARDDVAAMQILQEISTRLGGELQLRELAEMSLDAGMALTGSQRGNVQLYDAATGTLQIFAQRGFQQPFLDFFNQVHRGQAACGAAMEGGERLVVEDVRTSPLFAGKPSLAIMLQARVRAVIAAPLMTRSGRVIGMLSTHFESPHRPVPRELQSLDVLARQLADSIERHQTEEALRESEERLRHAQKIARVGTFDWNIQTGVNRWTPELEAMYGLPPGGFAQTHQAWECLVHADDRAGVMEKVHMAMKTGQFEGEWRILRPDGTLCWLAGRASVIRDESNRPLRMIGVNIDVTERKRAEEARANLAAIVDSSHDAILAKDLNGMITSWNRGAQRLLGYTVEEAVGQPISMLVPADRADEESGILERMHRGESTENFETIRRRKDGKLIQVSLSVSPVSDTHGRIMGASSIARDITRQKQAEERFRLAVEAAPNGMVVADQDGKMILVNSEMQRLFGYSREEMIGQSIELLVPARLGREHRKHREDFQANPRARMMGERSDLRARRKDATEFPVEIALSPIETIHGRWVLGAIVDITERKHAEEQRQELLATERALTAEKALRETESELARVVRALSVGELASSIAHEVNQPLAAVVTNAQAGLHWLTAESPDLLEARESLARIVRDANRASEVIRRIREFLRKESPPAAFLDINDVLQDALSLAQPELLKRGINLRTEFSGELPQVRGDRIQLQQVVLNLLMNGAQAMESTPEAKDLLILSRKSAGDRVLVAVRDAGAGLRPDHVRRMFDPFFSTKGTGMGMGLSISRSIVEAHGGQIWAELNDGPGLTVQFSLPAPGERPR